HKAEGQRGGAESLSPAGVFVFDARVLSHIPETGYQDIKEMLIPRLYRAGERVRMHSACGACPRVSSPESYLAVNAWLLERLGAAPAGCVGVGEAWVDGRAEVDADARLIGPVLVGPEARVAARALVVGPTVIGTGSQIGPGALGCRSVIWDRCRIGEEGHVDRCILTDDAVVAGPGLGHRVVGGGQAVHEALSRPGNSSRRTHSAAWPDASLEECGVLPA